MHGNGKKDIYLTLDKQERKFYNKYRTKYLKELAHNLHYKE